MSKKVVIPWIAPLQRVVGEPITDPAELAAIDRARKRRKRKKAALLRFVLPLQRVVGEAVTDPVELAALDKARKRQKRKLAGRKAPNRNGVRRD